MMKETSEEQRLPTIYSHLKVRIDQIEYIKKLIVQAVELRIAYGITKADSGYMIISALEMYIRSIERRLRNKRKREGRVIEVE